MNEGPVTSSPHGTADVGIVGLAVMGQNLALNLADHGYRVAVTNRSPERVETLVARSEPHHALVPADSVADLVETLAEPRVVLMMVQAGPAVDSVIETLVPLLDPGDIVVDGGNSHWSDSERRQQRLADCGLLFVGAGISGGEDGARHGPSIMPGGAEAAWPRLRPMLEAIAAPAGNDGQPCTSWIGAGGSGHFVKMIHNGIEYGDMQVLAEAHVVLRAMGLEPADQAELFERWNTERLRSYLIEITADILAATDEDGRPMIDVIVDAAGQKGTGRWTVCSAMELGQPMMLVAEAVGARMISSLLDLRASIADRHRTEVPTLLSGVVTSSEVEAAIYSAKIISYAQGFMVLQAGSDQNDWALDLGAIARLWRGGCIIQAAFLNDIAEAYESGPVENLLLVDRFVDALATSAGGLRAVVAEAARAAVPVPALASALAFYDGMASRRGSGHLIQAQRDYFGAHTYERVDRPRGEFHHTDWVGSGGSTTAGSYRA